MGNDGRHSALEVSGVSVSFGGLAAIDDVSLSVLPGEIVGLIGPNGAGKTTLFNVICGFVRPDLGSISIGGKLQRRIRPHQLTGLGVGRTLQGVGLWTHLTLADNVMTALHGRSKGDLASAMLGLPRSSRDERHLRDQAVEALSRLGVAEFADRLPTTLPYPVQKLASLARALVTQPDLLMLDEPASGLSEKDIESLGELVAGLRSEMAVLVVEHHMDFVMGLCDRIVVLNFGSVLASGTPDQVRANPAVAKAYLGEEVPSSTSTLVIEDLSASYGPIRALDGVSFSVPDGAITAVLGANGAGKTTLLRTITGLVPPQRGTARYDDVDLARLEVADHVRHGVAHVPEGRGVIVELTVEENLRLGGLFRRDRAGLRQSIAEVLELFPPLADRRRLSAHTLSGGERQMLVVGRALVARPRLLLLDEPSLGLAPLVTAQLMELLRRLVTEQGLTVLLVEQNARSALSVADRAVVLALGRVVMDDSAAAVGANDSLRHHYLGY